MPMNAAARRDPTARGWVGLSVLIAALLLVAGMVLTGSGLAGTAEGQGERGAIPTLTLDSNEPGQLVITWATPDPVPTDYRIRWANASMGFPSYNAPNEPERGNSHPAGDANTLTLDNLTPGENYKVQIRARYYNADRTVHERSGPWTATATQRVKDHPPAAPTGLAASSIEHDSVTLTWDDPQDAGITGYRVLRGTDAGSLSTIEADTASVSAEYTDTTVAAETTYFYAVLALSADGDSTQSGTISATTPAAPADSNDGTQDQNQAPAPTPTPPPPPVIAMVVPSDALTDRMTQLEVNLTNLPAGRYSVRVTVTNDVAAEVAGHDAVVVVSEPPQSSQQQETESDTELLPTDSLGYVSVSPGTPTVTQEGAEVLISWTAGVGNVELYYLARGLITGCQSGCWEVISIDGPDTSYRDLGVAPGRTYRYRVQAKYANMRSHFSAFTSITTAAVAEDVPMPPSGLTVRYDVPAAAIVLSWMAPDPASDVRNYRFNRCSFTSPMSSEDITCGEMLTGSTDTAYSDTTVEPGHHYIYNRLRAVGDHGDSYRTGWDRISVPAAGTLTAPTGLTAVHDENAGTATLSWTAPDPSTGLVDYRVLRCRFRLRNEADCTRILTGSTATTYTDTAVSGIRWSGVWYGVKTVTDVGDSFARYVYLRIE